MVVQGISNEKHTLEVIAEDAASPPAIGKYGRIARR